MRTTKRCLPLALLLFLACALAAGQTAPLDITFGYRFVKVDGSSDEYRTQINEREGLILRNVTFATSDSAARRASSTTSGSTPPSSGRGRRGPCAWKPAARGSSNCASPTAAPRASARSMILPIPCFPR